MEIEKIKQEIRCYLAETIDPIYEKFSQTKDEKDIKDLDEKLEILQSKIDVLYAIDEKEAEDFYLREIGTLPLKETLLG